MKSLLYIIFFFCSLSLQAKEIITYSNSENNISVGQGVSVLEDTTGKQSLQEILDNTTFHFYPKRIINLGVSSSVFWIRFSLLNKSDISHLLLNIPQPAPNNSELYIVKKDGTFTVQRISTSQSFYSRPYDYQEYIFDLPIPKDSIRQVYLKVWSSAQMTIPITIGKSTGIFQAITTRDLIFGIFFGIIFCMLFYNIFIYTSVKDNIYIYYDLYLLIAAISQCTLQGFSFRYLWPHSSWLATFGPTLFTNMGSAAAVVFTKKFLQTKKHLPVLDTGFTVFLGILIFAILLVLFNKGQQSFILMQITTLIGAVYVIILAVLTIRKGYRPARYYLLAWLSVCCGAIITVLKDYGLLDFTAFTANALEIGVAGEVIILAFALADRINTYKKEKDISQAAALHISQENERLIQQQNVMLEKQVAERTYDLKKTLRELQDAQIQLVEAEKMASLGQLTAGIAHEINNPINFVKSNVSPLQMDVQDLFELITEYQKLHHTDSGTQPEMLKKIRILENKLDPDFLKEEIESLIGGIEEGADRTAEIVRGLRSFSRLDESESKEVNIYENINSTLVLLRNNIPHYVKVRKHFEARAQIECYPGKLNQVFMNILTNGIHAIKAKPVKEAEEYIDISIQEVNDYMRIRIADTGIGMTDDVKHKIFEPFFTTKDVGEGTGLGMAIVFKIIEKHNGKISVQSSPGEGAIFIIDIPYILGSGTAITENEITETENADLQ